jgi:hypothetical protein
MSHVVSSLQSALLAVIYLTGAIGGSRAIDALPIGSTPRDWDKTSCAVKHHAFGLAAPHAPDDIDGADMLIYGARRFPTGEPTQ